MYIYKKKIKNKYDVSNKSLPDLTASKCPAYSTNYHIFPGTLFYFPIDSTLILSNSDYASEMWDFVQYIGKVTVRPARQQ